MWFPVLNGARSLQHIDGRSEVQIGPLRAIALPFFGMGGLYLAAAIGGLSYAAVGNTVTLIWAPSGLALAAVVLWGYPMAFAVALAAFGANLWTGVPWAVAVGIAAGNTAEALAGAWLLTKGGDFHAALDRRRDVLALVAWAATVSTAAGASLGVSTLSLAGLLPADGGPRAWFTWWLGDMMGVLVVAPALLVWLGSKQPAMARGKALEAALLGATLCGLSYGVFGPPEVAGRGYYPAALAVFPLVVWAALSFGQRGASVVSLSAATLAVWGTMQGMGPFVVDRPVDSLVRWCVFAIIMAVTGMLLAASVQEQRSAQARLRNAYRELEQQVSDRTRELLSANAELRREMSQRRELESDMIRIGEMHQQAMGRELHDGLGQHLTSLALLAASLQQRLSTHNTPEAGAAARIVDLANEASAMTQSLARGLYPVALEFGGLSAALARLAEQTQSLSPMRCGFRADPGAQVADSLVAINLYRIAQEAVNNAVKYSQASQVDIHLSGAHGQHRLCVSDDGIGLQAAQLSAQPGLGLHSMRYRARLLGCQLTMEPRPEGGTRIVVATSGPGSAA